MPQQVRRLIVVFIILGGALVGARHYLVPKTFGALGHYRAAAIAANAAKPMSYAGHEACALCHPDIVKVHDGARHRTVACEVCHGAQAAHVDSPADHIPPAPRERAFCPLCHAYDPARPTGFPQIDPITHNPGHPCITCHNPHAPVPPHTPQECSACHAEIARTKTLSKHATLPCTTCHEVQELHKNNPLASTPTKPQTREFCGQCHSQDAKGPSEIVRVDLSSHGQRYVCWQCHYPHSPEVQ